MRLRRGISISQERWDEMMDLLNRQATALEHTHSCERDISKTLKDLHKTLKDLHKLHKEILVLHKMWFGDSRGTVIPKKQP